MKELAKCVKHPLRNIIYSYLTLVYGVTDLLNITQNNQHVIVFQRKDFLIKSKDHMSHKIPNKGLD